MHEHRLPDADFKLMEQVHDEEVVVVLSYHRHLVRKCVLVNSVDAFNTSRDMGLTRVGMREWSLRSCWTCLLLIANPLLKMSLCALSIFCCLVWSSVWRRLWILASVDVPTHVISFFRMRQRGQGDRPRYLIVARRILICHEYHNMTKSYMGYSLFGIISRVSD